jgi:hypothetical protein
MGVVAENNQREMHRKGDACIGWIRFRIIALDLQN